MVLNRVNTGRSGGNATTAGVGMHSKRIQAGLSTQIVIQVAAEDGQKYTIGAVQSLDVSEDRPLQTVQEVGTDAIISIVPNGATTYGLTVTRMVFDFQRLPQSLQREYNHIKSQRRPFDIIVVDYNPYLISQTGPEGGDTDAVYGGGALDVDVDAGTVNTVKAIETTFKNCWFKSTKFTYTATNYLISESATLQCEDVFDNTIIKTIAGEFDSLERNTNWKPNSSIMSAFDAPRQ